jgi:hypothetical protein
MQSVPTAKKDHQRFVAEDFMIQILPMDYQFCAYVVN